MDPSNSKVVGMSKYSDATAKEYSVVVLCGGHGPLSTLSGLLSAGVAVRWVVAGSLPNGVSVQSGRVSIMCGGASLWASTTMVLSASTGSTVFCEEWVFAPLDTAITPSNSNG